jgi:hypothetical protein
MSWSPGETARKRVDEGLRVLAADLKTGKSDSLTTYLQAMSRFHRYTWDNVLLIWLLSEKCN